MIFDSTCKLLSVPQFRDNEALHQWSQNVLSGGTIYQRPGEVDRDAEPCREVCSADRLLIRTPPGEDVVHLTSAQLLTLAFAAACGPPTGEVHTLPAVFKPADYMAAVQESYGDDDRTAYLQEFLERFANKIAPDFPFRAGMTRQDIDRLEKLRGYPKWHTLTGEEKTQPDGRRLMLADKSSATFWFNGHHQYWVDIAFDRDRVSSIFIVPGNGSSVDLPFRFDGGGPHKGMWSALSDER